MKNTLTNTIKLSAAGLCLLASFTYANEDNCKPDESDVHFKHCDSQVGWYIGGQLGYAQTDISENDINAFYNKTGFEANSIDIDDSGFAFSLMAGYQFTTHWALEGAYIDLGERSVDFTGSTEDLDDFYDNVEHVYPQSGDGLSLALVGSWPLSENFKVSGKLGYWRWEGDYTTYDANSDVGSDKTKGNDLWFGAELNYRLSERTQVYLTAQRFNLDRDDNNVLGFGVRYYFGGEIQPAKTSEKVQSTIIAIAAVPLDSDKDGILDVQDDCANSNPLHKVDIMGCTLMQAQTFSFNLTIHYDKNSSEIPSSYDDKLQDLADFIKEYKVKQLHVYGHTSAPGSQTYNMKLSQKRAQSVADVLESKFNIAENIIKPMGRGEEALKNNSNTENAHQVNRRIELNIEEQLLLPVKR